MRAKEPKVKPISIRVNGEGRELYSYLWKEVEHPLPKSPTHYVVIEAIHRDFSIKRVTVYFNEDDNWESPYTCSNENKAIYAGSIIGEHSQFVSYNPNTVYYRFWVMRIDTDEVVHKGHTYSFLDHDNY